jgi:hypothetical protein
VNALAPFEPRGEGNCVGEVAPLGGGELVIHGLGRYKSVQNVTRTKLSGEAA